MGHYDSVMHELINKLNSYYVFPDVAEKLSKHLTTALSMRTYDGLTDPKEFASAITRDLFIISKDKHLGVFYKPSDKDDSSDDEITITPETISEIYQNTVHTNFGFFKVERLDGNIGYIDLRSFAPAEIGGDTAVAAMNFLANTYSLIIDLRNNNGGFPSMVSLICGYLFRPSVHLDSLNWRRGNVIEQTWSSSYVPGKHYGNKSVYVLTSSETFSAAEEFSYTLKQLRRATIVGERTAGGANPALPLRLTREFEATVPLGQAINPITLTNWEGTGVEPDIDVRGEDAFRMAYMQALNEVIETSTFAESARREAKRKLTDINENKPVNHVLP